MEGPHQEVLCYVAMESRQHSVSLFATLYHFVFGSRKHKESVLSVRSPVLIDTIETKEYYNQVAGHTKEAMRTYYHLVLKPLIKMKHFFRELLTYEMTFLGNCISTNSLKQFIPSYRGLYSIQHSPKSTLTGNSTYDDYSMNSFNQFIALEDLCFRYKEPTAMDIKIGTQTYEPTASISKIAKEVRKCSHQFDVGFRVVGLKSYDVVNETYSGLSKHFGRKIASEKVHEALAMCFYDGTRIRYDIIAIVIEKLDHILQ